MARIRYIKPEFFKDEDIATLGPWARLLYVGLWCVMDRNGVVEYRPKFLKAEIFPYDSNIREKHIEGYLAELAEQGMLKRVSWKGREYLYCPAWRLHQRPHPGEKAKYPIPDQTFLATPRDGEGNDSNGATHGEDGESNAGTGIGMGTGTGIGIGTGTGDGDGNGDRPTEDVVELTEKARRKQHPAKRIEGDV
jgi:hypothetical protein